jgi:hypothetical protein
MVPLHDFPWKKEYGNAKIHEKKKKMKIKKKKKI